MIRVLFDNTEINSDYIQSLSQNVDTFEQQFKVGVTLCRHFTLDVDNRAFSSIPSKVYLYEGNTIYATLNVDDVNSEDDLYTTFSLMDEMVNFNKSFKIEPGTSGKTVDTIINEICALHNISFNTLSYYMSDYNITWSEDVVERDFISYVAEVNAGYAFIDEYGGLKIESFNQSSSDTFNKEDCSSFKLGTHHLIDRVYVELGSATHAKPVQPTQNETLYLNSSNILFNDTGATYNIDNIINHIYDVVNGLNFYNIRIGQCPINGSVGACKMRAVSDGSSTYPFISPIDWKYNNNWIGGYEISLISATQQETKIVDNTKEKVKRLEIVVDRDKGRIDQILSDAEGHTGSFSLYLNEDDPDAVVSCINASADNIILNTKSLIFGNYPSGKYIEVKSQTTGCQMIGNGSVTIKPDSQFNVINNYTFEGSVYRGNDFYMTQYDSYDESTFLFHTNDSYLYNFRPECTQYGYTWYANRLYMHSQGRWVSSGTQIQPKNNYVVLDNYTCDEGNRYTANELKLYSEEIVGDTTYEFSRTTLNNYRLNSSYSNVEANRIKLMSGYESAVSSYYNQLNITNRWVDDAKRTDSYYANDISLFCNDHEHKLELSNAHPYGYTSGGNSINLRCNDDGYSKIEIINKAPENAAPPNNYYYNTVDIYAEDGNSYINLYNYFKESNKHYRTKLELKSNAFKLGIDYENGSNWQSKNYIYFWNNGNAEVNAGGILYLNGNSGIQLSGKTIYFSGGYVRYS